MTGRYDSDTDKHSLFCPEYFTGDGEQDPRAFVKSFRLWAAFHNLDDTVALAAFALLLRDKASTWFTSLTSDNRTSLNQLLELFITRYTSQEPNYKCIARLWDMKQGKSQSIQDFVAHILVKSEPLALSTETILAIVLNGLKPDLRSHVLKANAQNIDAVLHHGTLFEMATCFHDSDNPQILKQLSDMQAQLHQLQKQLMHFQTGSVPTDHSRHACAPSSIERAQGIASLHGQNAHQPCINGPTELRWSAPFLEIEPPLFPQAPRQPFFDTLCNKPNLRRRTRFSSFKSPAQIFQRCLRCARLHDAHFCPAIGAKCRFCFKLNHFAKACVSRPKHVSDYVNNPPFHRLQPVRDVRRHVEASRTKCYTPSTGVSSFSAPSMDDSSCGTRLTFNNAGEIDVYVYGKHRLALLDTGALVSAVSTQFLKELPSHRKLDKHVTQNLCGANGQRLKNLGQVELPVNLNGLIITHKFMVIDNLISDIILGTDFLNFSNAVIDYSDRTVSFYDRLVTLNLISRDDQIQSSVLRLPARVKLAPQVVTLLPISVPRRFIGTNAIIQPLHNGPKQEIFVANILVRPKTQCSVVHILNPTCTELVLPQALPIASIHVADPKTVRQDTSPSPPSASQEPNSEPLDPDQRAEMLKDLGILLDSKHLSSQQVEQLYILICRNRQVFAKDLSEIPGTDLATHHIETFGTPVRQRPYRCSPETKAEISRQVKQMEADKIIEPSFSPWASPVILVSKKGGSLRFVLDLRSVTRHTVGLSFPIPTLENVLDTLAESHPTIFSALDMKSGYFQIKLSESSKQCTSFIAPQGQFCFNRLPFGAKNSVAAFQSLMQQVFKGELYKFCLVYIDDILVFSSSFDEHLKHLQMIFDRLLEANLRSED